MPPLEFSAIDICLAAEGLAMPVENIADHVQERVDSAGRTMYLYTLTETVDAGEPTHIKIWAYSLDDAFHRHTERRRIARGIAGKP